MNIYLGARPEPDGTYLVRYLDVGFRRARERTVVARVIAGAVDWVGEPPPAHLDDGLRFGLLTEIDRRRRIRGEERAA